MKKTALELTFVFVLLVSSVFGVQVVDVVEANPFWSSPPYPAEPSQEFPTIKIDAPNNGEVLTTTYVEASFTVTKPNSWNYYWNFSFIGAWNRPVIGSYIVHIYLDGKLRAMRGDPGRTGFPNADYSIFLNNLARGIHNVSVTVVASTFYDDPDTDGFLTFPRNITETQQFTINADLPAPSSSSEPTPEPETLPATLLFVTSVGISLAVIGLFVYFKKRK
jgi:hypothetical protein